MAIELLRQALIITTHHYFVLFLFFNLLMARKKKGGYVYVLILLMGWGITTISIVGALQITMQLLLHSVCLLFLFDGRRIDYVLTPLLFLQIGSFYDLANNYLLYGRTRLGYPILALFSYAVLLLLTFFWRKKPPLLQLIGNHLLLCWLFLSSLLFVLRLFLLNESITDQQKGLIFAFLLLMMAVFCFFAYQAGKLEKVREKNLLLEKQLDFQQKQMEQNKEYLQQARKMMHDSKNLCGLLERLIREDQKEEALEKVMKLSELFQRVKLLEFTGNVTIDSLFYFLVQQCRKEEIHLEQEIQIEQQVAIDKSELSLLLSVLFDTAIAIAKNAEVPRSIHLSVSAKTNFLVIDMSYSRPMTFSGKLNCPSLALLEEKGEKNFERVQRIVEKHTGLYEKRKQKNTYCVKLALPLRN